MTRVGDPRSSSKTQDPIKRRVSVVVVGTVSSSHRDQYHRTARERSHEILGTGTESERPELSLLTLTFPGDRVVRPVAEGLRKPLVLNLYAPVLRRHSVPYPTQSAGGGRKGDGRHPLSVTVRRSAGWGT